MAIMLKGLAIMKYSYLTRLRLSLGICIKRQKRKRKDKSYFCRYAGKWRNSREREKAEALNLSGFLPFIA